jgi:hypothetical protein
LHFVVGLPLSAMPTGTASYSMLGSSAGCTGSSCTGVSVNSSSLSVNFDALSVSLAMQMALSGGANAGTYNFVGSPGSIATPAGTFTVNGNLDGPVGPSMCNSFNANGFLSGAGAVRAGMIWSGSIGFGSTQVRGATAYKKQ